MTRPPHDAEFNARAVAGGRGRRSPSPSSRGNSACRRRTLYRWREASRQHLAERFVGHAPRRGEDQQRRDWERAVYDLVEELTAKLRLAPQDA